MRPIDADAAPGELRDFGDRRARAFLPLALAYRRRGTQSTATFLRSVATACAFLGTSRSPRMMARSALPSPSSLALVRALSVCVGRSRTWLCCWSLKACASALNDLEVVAVGRTDGDPQRHRPRRNVIAGRQHANDRQQRRPATRMPAAARAERGEGGGGAVGRYEGQSVINS